MENEERYTVWVGGAEVNDQYLSWDDAQLLADTYRVDGYSDVEIEDNLGI